MSKEEGKDEFCAQRQTGEAEETLGRGGQFFPRPKNPLRMPLKCPPSSSLTNDQEKRGLFSSRGVKRGERKEEEKRQEKALFIRDFFLLRESSPSTINCWVIDSEEENRARDQRYPPKATLGGKGVRHSLSFPPTTFVSRSPHFPQTLRGSYRNYWGNRALYRRNGNLTH